MDFTLRDLFAAAFCLIHQVDAMAAYEAADEFMADRALVGPAPGSYLTNEVERLLSVAVDNIHAADDPDKTATDIKKILSEFKIQVSIKNKQIGPVVTLYEAIPAAGVKIASVEKLADDMALRLKVQSVRVIAGTDAIGIEIPNAERAIVPFGEVMREIANFKAEIPVVLGRNIPGQAIAIDLTKAPHLLIAGVTGSGKSIFINSLILSIIHHKRPTECKLILIDPKSVELNHYADIPHLLMPLVTETDEAIKALQYCIHEMNTRYKTFSEAGARDIEAYNRRENIQKLPYIVVVIDEFSGLMAADDKVLEYSVSRLAAKSRAAGIHLVLATQRPSADVITGTIKANISSRIAFKAVDRRNSQIILDRTGAESLLGNGDLLYLNGNDLVRIQGTIATEEDNERIIGYAKTYGKPDYIFVTLDDEDEEEDDEEEENENDSFFAGVVDPLYEKAIEIVKKQGKASTSYIQRCLQIGYNRAARMVDEMERKGIVAPPRGTMPREFIKKPKPSKKEVEQIPIEPGPLEPIKPAEPPQPAYVESAVAFIRNWILNRRDSFKTQEYEKMYGVFQEGKCLLFPAAFAMALKAGGFSRSAVFPKLFEAGFFEMHPKSGGGFLHQPSKTVTVKMKNENTGKYELKKIARPVIVVNMTDPDNEKGIVEKR